MTPDHARKPGAPGDDPTESDIVGRIIEGVREGDRRVLARAITLSESTRPDHRETIERVLESVLADTGESIRIGISGPPGVGKSTFIEALGLRIVDDGFHLAVLAVDPSSQRTGGSILGDRTRMIGLSRRSEAFIRPSPGGSQLGGVARRTREAMLLCEAAGSDVVIVETIGVGQSEVAVSEMVDMFILLVAPGGGDDLQGIKRGIMELADLIVVNKADGDLAAAAQRTAADHRNAVALLQPARRSWKPEVLTCSSLDRSGIDEVWQAIQRFRDAMLSSGELAMARSTQAEAWMWSEVRDALLTRFSSDERVRAQLPLVGALVSAGSITPAAAARGLLDLFAKYDHRPNKGPQDRL